MKLLDLFCGAGGAAMGYHRAGFEVVGVDTVRQPNYPFFFVKDDALKIIEHLLKGYPIYARNYDTTLTKYYDLDDFAAIHASPPCPRYSSITRCRGKQSDHPDLVEPVRSLLEKTSKPYVIENVPGSPLKDYVVLCGTMFGLQTPCGAALRRHRHFETNWPLLVPSCRHKQYKDSIGVNGTGSPVGGARRTISVTGSTPQANVVHNTIRQTYPRSSAAIAMGIEWMKHEELVKAIPPAYTEYIGKQLMDYLRMTPVIKDKED